MAFKIATKQAPAEDAPQPDPAEEETQESPDEAAAESPDDEAQEQSDGSGGGQMLLQPETAGYQGPENGPFMCGNCVYFGANGPNTCHFVAGKIDQMGCCNLFESAGAADQEGSPEDGSMQEEQLPEDGAMPTEEDMPEDIPQQ
jgi:hypothetical protein